MAIFSLIRGRCSLPDALFLIALGVSTGMAGPAQADQPVPWQMGYQEAASPVMAQVEDLHNFITIIMVLIVLLVVALLAYVAIRFSAKANPVPSRTTHHTLLEVAWTVIPIVILVVISVPSFKLLYYMDRTYDADITIKAIGHQWYWSYEYPDHGNFAFDSFMKYPEDLAEGEPRLLAVDNDIVVPVGKNVRILITSTDVIHSFAVPSLGLKTDANPGRINETWVRVDKPGTYYGQCSELCGTNHGFMPLAVRAVPQEEFDAWVIEAREKFASADGPAPVSIADAR